MLGLAGIGHFYLRPAVPSVPGILLLRREDFLAEGGRLTLGVLIASGAIVESGLYMAT
jgi:hypothetical protein